MHIKEITFSLEATIPHPKQQYANVKPHIGMTLAVSEGDDLEAAKTKISSEVLQLWDARLTDVLQMFKDPSGGTR